MLSPAMAASPFAFAKMNGPCSTGLRVKTLSSRRNGSLKCRGPFTLMPALPLRDRLLHALLQGFRFTGYYNLNFSE